MAAETTQQKKMTADDLLKMGVMSVEDMNTLISCAKEGRIHKKDRTRTGRVFPTLATIFPVFSLLSLIGNLENYSYYFSEEKVYRYESRK